MDVLFLRSFADLERAIPAWEQLARAAIEPNPFYEHWMLLPALEAYGACSEVGVALVREGAELAGVFPLERRARYKGLPAATLRSWLHPHCLLGTPLVRNGSERACLGALFKWLDAQCSFVEFRYVPAAEPFHRALGKLLAERGARAIVSRRYERGLLRKNRSTMSGRLRRTLARNARRLGRIGVVGHTVLQPIDDIAGWTDQFLQLEASGWKGREGSAMACNPINKNYAVEIFRNAFQRGRLLGCGIDLDGRPIAQRTSFIADSGSYAFKIAYDEGYGEFSPGVMLELDNVRLLDAHPQLEWMDSFTDDDNLALARMWPDRRTIETFAVAVRPWGELAAAALPALRWLKNRVNIHRRLVA